MVQTPVQSLTLEDFLQQPETKPASEFINGQISQKPMPQGEHSTLQGELVNAINTVAKSTQIAYAFPELRCVFGGNTLVPDVAVFRWSRIPRQPSGRVANRFEIHPDWAIEILSPEQPQTLVLAKLLHCVEHGTELGWLVDPETESILVIFPESRVKLYQGTEPLPVLLDVALAISSADVFAWLTLPE
jgi:Uma2 family endonuclease